MNIVQALNKVKTDILNFVTINLQNKSDITHTHDEYALTTDVNAELEQITSAMENMSGGKTLTEHLAEESMVLTSLQYGDTLPDPGISGRIFFKRVSG